MTSALTCTSRTTKHNINATRITRTSANTMFPITITI